MRRFLLGLIIGVLIVPATLFVYFRLGHPPVAVADQPIPLEKQIVRIPLHARIGREMPTNAPVALSEPNLVSGAKIYREQCALCHGLPNHASDIGSQMYPLAPQLWASHGNHVGVSDDPPGETYWKVANGIRLTGMPAFNKLLNPTEVWQVSLLLANADKPLPNRAMDQTKQP